MAVNATTYTTLSTHLTNLMQKILFYNKFIICLYMFRALCAHHQEFQNCIIQHLVSSHLSVAISHAQVERSLLCICRCCI